MQEIYWKIKRGMGVALPVQPAIRDGIMVVCQMTGNPEGCFAPSKASQHTFLQCEWRMLQWKDMLSYIKYACVCVGACMIDNVIWLSTLTSDSSLIIIHTGILQSTFLLLWNLVNWLRKGLSVIAESNHGWSVGMAAKKDKGDEQKNGRNSDRVAQKGFHFFLFSTDYCY